jgi:diketogulonate reductase-like aldo/keto reductase
MSRTRNSSSDPTRRAVLASMGALGASLTFPPVPAFGQAAPGLGDIHKREIPSTGEAIPAVGMGTWVTFNVGNDTALRNQRTQVLQTFFDMGGGMVDSSPMYGSSEDVIGYALERIKNDGNLFSATKVWTMTKWLGVRQMEESERLWGLKKFDLMQIHNLLDWDSHIETLKAWKAEGRIRYIGITTSHGSRHAEFEKLMRELPLDFAQFTYNIVDREVETRLLPLAADKGIAVICNRPFRHKQLFHMYEHHPLPEWASEIGCTNWAQFFLKFLISHPAVTCAIPATTRVDHMRENMGALKGPLPDGKMRAKMVQYIEGLPAVARG